MDRETQLRLECDAQLRRKRHEVETLQSWAKMNKFLPLERYLADAVCELNILIQDEAKVILDGR